MTHKVERISKLEAARREINAAIRMYFAGEDPLAVHALAAGGMQIISDLGKKRGQNFGIESGIEYIRAERQAEFRKLMRKPQNFIKHADRDGDEDVILEYRPGAIDVYVFIAASAYKEFTGRNTPETCTFLNWFAMRNPELLSESEYKGNIAKLVSKYGEFDDNDKSAFATFIVKIREEKTFSESEMNYRP